MVSTIEFRRRLSRGASVMTDTFGAIATMTALAITAENFHRATPAEWDRALGYGEVCALVGRMAGAHRSAGRMFQNAHRKAIENARPAAPSQSTR
jgi:hypothetical protein